MSGNGRVSRRTVLGGVGAVGLASGLPAVTRAGEPGDGHGAGQRHLLAYRIRERAAAYQRDLPLPEHRDNGDEAAYSDRVACFAKGLPRDELGLVDPHAHDRLLRALATDRPGDLDQVPLGGEVKLANPHAAYTFGLVGADSHHLGLEPAPRFASATTASELVELYWQALCRDVPFDQYGTHPIVAAACEELSRLPGYQGPGAGGRVTPATVFRGGLPGETDGPYVSQFLLKDVPFEPATLVQAYRVPLAGDDHVTDYGEWLRICRGSKPAGSNKLDDTRRFLRCGRDLAEYSHQNFSYQPYLGAALMLIWQRARAWDRNNPYLRSKNQDPGVTFDWSHPLDVVARAAMAAQQAAWFQKWCVHRRLRPEEFAGHLHNHLSGLASYPFHADLITARVLGRVRDAHGGYLLPLAYPEGCPAHPSYPAAHATVAGACVTVLKAFFDEDFVLADPVVPDPDGLTLRPWRGRPLTAGGELNKLAFAVAYGRNFAGVHWRSDTMAGLRLGEAVAEGMLSDLRRTLTERFAGFAFPASTARA
jgi:hypothetical protein